MFIQVIQGRASEPDAVRHALDQWQQELAPGAVGWLGTTAGITTDGQLVAVARFESAEAAQRNSDRPEQHRWWTETAQLIEGEPVFHDCPQVDTFLAGGSDQAGFVQVLQGTVDDPDRMWQMMPQMSNLNDYRPEIIGGMIALEGDGSHFTQVVYFTSEQEARQGESKEPPAEVREAMEGTEELFHDVRYLDLTEPWLYSPAR
jgi:hypothetical protein